MDLESIPKKIYRHVLKGLQFFHVIDGSGCTLVELISYVFLKNERIYNPLLIERWVKDVLHSFDSVGLLQKDLFGNYQLHNILVDISNDNDEDFILNPEQNIHQHSKNSSQESLSTVPYYQRVLQRKGNQHVLPKHRIHMSQKTLAGTSDDSNEENSLLQLITKGRDKHSDLNSMTVDAIRSLDKLLEISSDED